MTRATSQPAAAAAASAIKRPPTTDVAVAAARYDGSRCAAEEAREEARIESMSEKQIAREIRALEKKMLEHARNLEFEQAAAARDRLAELKKRMFGVELASE